MRINIALHLQMYFKIIFLRNKILAIYVLVDIDFILLQNKISDYIYEDDVRLILLSIYRILLFTEILDPFRKNKSILL